jgi:hypothetical protein
MKHRYGNNKSKLPYSYEIIQLITGSSREISEMERELQATNKDNKYIPKVKFKGMFECFSKLDIQMQLT